MTDTSNVFIIKNEYNTYPLNPPFHPSQEYPEYNFDEISKEKKNIVYDSFRDLLHLMNLDNDNYGSKEWNPLGEFISPGFKVVIKPNLVIDNELNQDCITTHPSILRAIIDYVLLALKGEGEIIIGDAPLQQCNFLNLIEKTGLKDIIFYYESKGIEINLIDFRTEKMISKYKSIYSHVTTSKKNMGIKRLKGDPNGYKVINLGTESNLQKISINGGFNKFRVTNYDPNLMKYAHNYKDHKFLISNSILQADIVINVPKIKAHRKAGLTGCLKNTVGINGHKDWLPHHKQGSLEENGDEYQLSNLIKRLNIKLTELNDINLIKYPKIYKLLYYPILLFQAGLILLSKLIRKDKYYEGSWHGNDTLWRTIMDLNQILIYTDKFGKYTSSIQRKRLYFCDGIISGENEGPLEPTPKKTGFIISGLDPLLIDLTIAELFNFNFKNIPQIINCFKIKDRRISNNNPEDLRIISNKTEWNNKKINELKDLIKFNPTSGWKNFIEKK